MDKLFKYYLKSGDNYYRVVNGTVILDSIETELQHAPIDWQDTEISFDRNTNFWGIFIENSLPSGFNNDGAKIIRYLMYSDSNGLESEVTLYVKKRIPTTTLYEFYYEGTLNLYTAVDEKDQVIVEILDKGVSSLIKSRKDTPVEIPLTTSNSSLLLLDGVLLRSNALFIPGQGDSTGTNLPENTLAGGTSVETLNIVYSGQQKAATSFISPQTQEYTQHAAGGNYNTNKWLFRANTDLTNVNFSGIIQSITNVDTTSYVQNIIVRVRRNGVQVHNQNIYASGSLPGNTDNSLDIPINANLSIPLISGDLVYVLSALTIPNLPTTKTTRYPNNKSILYVTYNAKVAATTCRVMAPLDLMKGIMSNISDNQFSVISDYLTLDQTDTASRFKNWDTAPKFVRYTSGDSLRALANAKIKNKFSEIFEDLYSNFCVGLGVDGTNARIEPLSYFFKDTLISEITNTGEISVSPYIETLYNQIKVGYESYDNNTTAGKNEFNTGISFVLDKRKYSEAKEDDLVSPVRFDISGIESVRAETLNSEKQDNRADNDTFGIEIDPVPLTGGPGAGIQYYKPYRPAGTITGTDDPVNTYNVTVSPGRKLRRHLPRIRSYIRKGNLKYQSIDKNPDLVSTFGAGQVIETADISVETETYQGHNVKALFLPWVFEFEFSVNYNMYNLVKSSPYGYLSFDYYGSNMKAYILSLSFIPAKGSYKCKLISHPDNDITKLIR